MKLTRHIQQNHPTDENLKPFSICDEIGFLAVSNCCFNKKKNETTEDLDIEIPHITQQLGLGASLFLMVTKALAWLFFFLTMLNMPAFAFYYSGNESMKVVA